MFLIVSRSFGQIQNRKFEDLCLVLLELLMPYLVDIPGTPAVSEG